MLKMLYYINLLVWYLVSVPFNDNLVLKKLFI